ncbi:FtsK/SpoIIIE domain-containing protein [Kitasatospora sp. NPDC048194]|uniref:FtsK/SpoIIIE domain-containing protein n=1 Tax=Kitasatospora sp. NPDC048194 TaxID=3364045 RepID=UPI0037128F9D
MTDLIGRPEDGVYVADVIDLGKRMGRAARAAGLDTFGALPEPPADTVPAGYGPVVGQVVVDGQVVGTVDLAGQVVDPEADWDEDEDQGEAGPVSWWEREHWQVIPPAFAGPEQAKATMRQAAALAANRARFHGLRVPVYGWRVLRVAAFGARHAVGEMWHYALASEYAEEIRAAKRSRDREAIAQARAERRAVIRERLTSGRAMVCYGAAAGLLWLAATYGLVAAGSLLTTAAFFLGGRAYRLMHEGDEPLQLLDTYAPQGPRTDLGADRITEALVAAKFLAEGQSVKMVALPLADGPHTARATFDMPGGKTAAALVKPEPVEAVASALGVESSWLDLEQDGPANRVSIWLTTRDPFGEPRRSPLLDMDLTAGLDAFDGGVPLAFDKRGRTIRPRVRDSHSAIGGATRSGKGMGIANLVLGSAFDVRINFRNVDGKPPEHWAYAPICSTMFELDPERLLLLLEAEIAEMNRRKGLLREAGRKRLTTDLLHLMPVELVTVDELITYLGKHVPEKLRQAIEAALVVLAAQGASYGILLDLATQYPSTDVLPELIRANCSSRWAMRTANYTGTNAILGAGSSGAGYKAELISKKLRGLGWLAMDGIDTVLARSFVIYDGEDDTPDDVSVLMAKAVDLRQRYNRLPGQFEDPIERYLIKKTGVSSAGGGPKGDGTPGIISAAAGVLTDLVAVFEKAGQPDRLTTAQVLDGLAALRPGVWSLPALFPDGPVDQAVYVQRGGTELSKAIAEALQGTGRALKSTGWTSGGRANGYKRDEVRAAAGLPALTASP